MKLPHLGVATFAFSLSMAIVACYSDNALAFSLTSDAFPLSRSTRQLSQARFNIAATSVGTKAIFAGGTQQGTGPYSNVDIFDLSTGLTRTVAHLSIPRHSAAATTVGDIAIFAGGSFTEDRAPSSVVDLYDDSTGLWTTAALSQPRHGPAAASHGTKAYISGGYVGPGMFVGSEVFSDVIDIYDSSTNQWSAMNMPTPRSGHSSIAVGDKILFAGGKQDGFPVVDILDVVTGTWSTGQLSDERRFMTATAVGDKAVFVGGIMSSQYQDEIDIYDASTDTWASAALPHPTGLMGVATIDHYALFAGGAYTQDYDDVYVYDAVSDTWLDGVPGLSAARHGLVGTSVGDVALFAGGYGFDVIDVFQIPVPEPRAGGLLAIATALITALHRRKVIPIDTAATENVRLSACSADRMTAEWHPECGVEFSARQGCVINRMSC